MATSEVGTITSLWRYPVKSMMGEELLEQRRERSPTHVIDNQAAGAGATTALGSPTKAG